MCAVDPCVSVMHVFLHIVHSAQKQPPATLLEALKPAKQLKLELKLAAKEAAVGKSGFGEVEGV